MSLLDRALNVVRHRARGHRGFCWESEAHMRATMAERGRRPGERSIGRVLRQEQRRAGTTLRWKIVPAGHRLPNGWGTTRRRKVYWFATRADVRREERAEKRAADRGHREAQDRAHEQRRRQARATARAARLRDDAAELLAPAAGDALERLAAAAARQREGIRPPPPIGPAIPATPPPDEAPAAFTPEDHAQLRLFIEAGEFSQMALFLEQRKPPPR